MRLRSVIITLGGLCGPPVLPGQVHAARGVIDGLVSDTNLVALADASVSILGSGVRVATGANGRFRITGLRTGNYILAVQRIGYVPIAVAIGATEGDTLRPSFTLQRIATALDTMIVTAKSTTAGLAEFEERKNHNAGGHFITADEIEKRGSVMIADIIRVVPGVRIIDVPPLKGVNQIAVNTRLGSCGYQLFLDGVPMPARTNLANLPPPQNFAAIEVYSGPATIPLQYKFGTASCGVILLWTKAGG